MTLSNGTASMYEVLGVSSQANSREIKEAYHALALRSHPDKHTAPPLPTPTPQALGTAEAHDSPLHALLPGSAADGTAAAKFHNIQKAWEVRALSSWWWWWALRWQQGLGLDSQGCRCLGSVAVASTPAVLQLNARALCPLHLRTDRIRLGSVTKLRRVAS